MAAFLLVPFADRMGRRRLFLVSLVGLSLATFSTAFTQTIGQFIALQMLARAFMVTCSATSFVIITEEFPAAHRGWGIGILGALGAMGYGLGLLLFAAIEVLPLGWRALMGAAPGVDPPDHLADRHGDDRASAGDRALPHHPIAAPLPAGCS